MEGPMCKHIVMITVSIAAVSLGSLVSAQAGGGATSAPSKYNGSLHNVKLNQVHNHLPVLTAVDYRITEFSSSSAKASPPKR
jgi:hypothetical protein